MRQIRRRSQRGFTLIELLIVIALLLIIMLMIANMFDSTRKLYNVAAQRGEVFTQGRLALDQIEDDLKGILPNNASVAGAVSKDLLLFSQRPKGDWVDYEAYTTDRNSDSGGGPMGPLFQDTDFPINVVNSTSRDHTDLTEIQPIIAFMTYTKWWDQEERDYKSGLAQVVYYLKKRKDYQLFTASDTFRPGSAYLMRLIIPQGEQIRITPGQEITQPDIPREEDICGSVLAMRVWAVNHAAAAANANSSAGSAYEMPIFVELNDTRQTTDSSMKDRLRKGESSKGTTGDTATQVSAKTKLTFAFGATAGSNAPNEARVFTVGSYPVAIMVELTIVNDDFSMDDEGEVEGTVRTFRRVITLPAVEPASSLPRSEIDLLERPD